MFTRILVPVDSSTFAEQAVPHAVALAKATGATLYLVLVHEMRPLGERVATLGSELVEAQLRELEEEYLETLAERIGADLGQAPEIRLLNGTAAPALARFTARNRIDVVVMSTHGRGGLNRAWIGSVADALIRRARVPMVLVKPGDDAAVAPAARFGRVLVAVDGSEPAESAVNHASALCAATGAACTIVRVVVPPTRVIASRIPDTAAMVHERTESAGREAEQYLHELVERRPDLPESTRTEVVTAYGAADAILDAAESAGADLIAIGTRGHGGAARLILGSVADKVIRAAPVPVLVCPAV
jgi:nucleotide-binding universal stress UspA family protein